MIDKLRRQAKTTNRLARFFLRKKRLTHDDDERDTNKKQKWLHLFQTLNKFMGLAAACIFETFRRLSRAIFP